MHIASPELCKELYEMSAWVNTFFWYEHPEATYPVYPSDDDLYPYVNDVGKPGSSSIPAYDIGFILHKLPKLSPPDDDMPYWTLTLSYVDRRESNNFFDDGNSYWRKGPRPNEQVWVACYREQNYDGGVLYDYIGYDEEPTNALCKLAIELFKQDVLPVKEMK